MAYLMGIDLGTSSLKTIIIDELGTVVAQSAENYQFDIPFNGFAEQDPEVWWKACCNTVNDTIRKFGKNPEEIAGISFSGQMHGLVMLDNKKKVIRPSILHCDARSYEQVSYINQKLGREQIKDELLNPIYTGFMLPSLLWMLKEEPLNYEKIKYVFLPKDYIKFKLTYEINSDYSDASATLAFDIKNLKWSEKILDELSIEKQIFPKCYSTCEEIGRVTKKAAEQTGLQVGTPVICGGADQVMQSMGNGVIRKGQATVNIGTSGQVCIQSDKPIKNKDLNTNTFCGYQKGKWYTMGAIINAGLSLNWLNQLFESTDYEEMNKAVEKVSPGSEGVIFLPYLNGERTPYLNPNISGMFLGINLKTKRPQLTRAVMEGVTFALSQCIELMNELELYTREMIASGGGARSKAWLQIQTDIYNIPLKVAKTEEQACLGAAIAAGVGSGIFSNVEEGCTQIVKYQDKIYEPIMENHEKYQEYYRLFKKTYQESKGVLEEVTELGRRR